MNKIKMWDRSHGKAPDKTDGIERYTIVPPNFSMSQLLISESAGELHCKNCVPSMEKKRSQLVTSNGNNK